MLKKNVYSILTCSEFFASLISSFLKGCGTFTHASCSFYGNRSHIYYKVSFSSRSFHFSFLNENEALRWKNLLSIRGGERISVVLFKFVSFIPFSFMGLVVNFYKSFWRSSRVEHVLCFGLSLKVVFFS